MSQALWKLIIENLGTHESVRDAMLVKILPAERELMLSVHYIMIKLYQHLYLRHL